MKSEKEVVSTEKKAHYFLILLYSLSLIVLFLMFSPFLTPLILGGIIIMFLYPVNMWVKKRIKNSVVSSLLMTFFVLVVIVIPSFFLVTALAEEASVAYTTLLRSDLDEMSASLSEFLGIEIDLGEQLIPVTRSVRDYITGSIFHLLSSAAELLAKLFLMFFLIYYGFKEGDVLLKKFMALLPMTKKHKEGLKEETARVLHGVLYGQILIAIIQGIVGGIGFWIFGVPNPVFWGFVMGVLAFVPLLGPFMVWLPASLALFFAGDTFNAIGLFFYGLLLTSNLDNILRPKLIGSKARMHPLLVLIGIFGGIALFGFVGMLIGPVVLAITILIVKFFNKDVRFVS